MWIEPAYAQQAGAAAQPGGGLMSFLPMILIFVVFYFLLIRPQMKKQKEVKQMLEALQKGDEVVTVGGVVGRVAKIDEQFATLEVSDSVELMVQRQAIQSVLPKGTWKKLG